LEWAKFVTVAVMWRIPLERGEGALPTGTLNKKELQLQQAGRAVFWRKQ
jgi:hypothetical protein